MASAVQITITVDASQPVPALDQLGRALDSVGVKGQVAMKKVGDGMNAIAAPAVRWSQTVTQHSTTSLDAVRLLSQEFGLRLPRAMEAMLSRMPQITNALGSVLGGMAAIAAAQVFVHVGEEIYGAYKKYVDLNAEAEKYIETLKKTAEQDIGNTRSLETTRQRLNQAQGNAGSLPGDARSLQQGAFGRAAQGDIAGAIGMMTAAHDAAHENVVAQGQVVTLTKQNVDQIHTQALAQIELNHAMDSTLGKAGEIAAATRKQHEINAENRGYNRKQEMSLGNFAPDDAGAAEERMKNQTADADAAAKTTLLGRETAMTLMKLDHERIESALSGEAQLHQKLMDDLAEMRLRLTNAGQGNLIGANTATITDKYSNDESERLVKQQNDHALAVQRAGLGGLKGRQQIDAAHDLRLTEININPALAADPAAAAAERVAAQQEANQKLQDLDKAFSDHAKQMIDERTADQLGAFAKVDAEAARSAKVLQDSYDAAYKSKGGGDTGDAAAHKLIADAKAAIDADAANKKGQLTQRNNAEDLQYDKEAADAERRVKEDGVFGWAAAYKNGIAEIQAAEAERIAKLQEDAVKEGLAGEEVARRKADIDRTANAQIAQQNQQLQHTIAGNLQAAFTDPVQFIKSRMEQMFFEIVAAWIMRMQVFKQLFGSTMGGLTPGGTGGAASPGGAGGILGAVGQAVHGVAAPGAPASSNPIAGMSGTRGYVNGSPDLGKIYGNIPGGGTNTFPGNPTLPGGGSASIPGVNAPYDGPDGTDSGLSATIPSIPAPSGSGFPGSGGASSGAGGLGGLAAAGFGGYTAYQSTVKAFDSGNPLTGALGDAGAGATIGMMFGPEGALIGGAAGALVGLAAGTLGWATGEGGNIAARTWYAQNTRQQLEADEQQQGGGDFQSQISSANKTAADGLEYMRVHFGKSSADWVWSNYMQAELKKVTAEIAATATGGRFAAVSSAAQFHTGGDITGFGSYATSPTEGWIHAMMGETVMNTQAVGAHGPMLRAMNAGASATDIASAYLAGSGGGRSGGGATYNAGDLHVHTLDTKTMSGWLKGGGAQLIDRHLNDYAGQYAGDGVSG